MIFFYKIYGMVIKSEIELPEVPEVEEQAASIEINYGKMPELFKKKFEEKIYLSIQGHSYKWFYFSGEGNFLIENGTRITVELDQTADDKHIRALILGSCLGSIMYQRDILSIHGSAVVWKDKAIIISGNPGVGKTTISTEFRRRGSLLLADDMVTVTGENGNHFANPAYPQQKLCTDTAINYGYELSDLTIYDEEKKKYAVMLTDAFCPDNAEIAALICVSIHNEEKLDIEEIKGSIKLEYIIRSLYTFHDYKLGGINSNTFHKCLEFAEKVPIIRVKRPSGKYVTSQLVEKIINLFENNLNIKESGIYAI